ncbi:hypothetical protein [Xenorhabdus entomophaga]|uniref:hypothetical protein n=1 Tax=Xenorhabdus entomophaga TaxID=3136257 RepID=UPI0030F39A5E
MLDALNTSILLDRMELMCKLGCSEDFNDNDRRTAFYWLGELTEQVKREMETLIEKPHHSGLSNAESGCIGLQQV